MHVVGDAPKGSLLFCVLISTDVKYSPNSLLITENIVSPLLCWLYRTFGYPRFVFFLYLPWVPPIGTSWYRGGIMLYALWRSRTST